MTDSKENQRDAVDVVAAGGGAAHGGAGGVLGTVLDGRLELLAVLGQGGMGVVYKAWHRLLEKHVAVKMLHPHLIADERQLMQMRAEARIVAELQHENIVAVHAFGTTENGAPYVVMELLDGEPLSAALADGKVMPFPRCLNLMLQVTRALEYAHEKGIVHRDLKPSNIMVLRNDDGTEQVKIVDFGIARRDTQSATLTQVVGSPPYMSPEQCMGKRGTPGSDLYSVGCVMHETVSGAPPFCGDTPMDTLQMQLNDPPPALRSLRGDTPLPLQNIVLKLLAKNPESRYASASELIKDITDTQQAFAGLRAEPQIVPPPAHKPRKEKQGGTWLKPALLCALVLAAVAGVGVFVSSSKHADTEVKGAETFDLSARPATRFQQLLGKLKSPVKNPEELLAKLEDTLKELARQPDTTHAALVEAELSLSNAYFAHADVRKGLRHAQQAVLYQEGSKKLPGSHYVRAMVAVANGYLLAEDKKLARQSIEMAESVLPPGYEEKGHKGFELYKYIVPPKVNLYLIEGTPEKALPLMKMLAGLNVGGHEEHRCLLLRALNQHGKYEEVIESGNRWLNETSAWSPPYSKAQASNEVADAYLRLHQDQKAVDCLNKSLGTMQTHNIDWLAQGQISRLKLASIRRQQGKYALEADVLETACAQESEFPSVPTLHGRMLEELNAACQATGRTFKYADDLAKLPRRVD